MMVIFPEGANLPSGTRQIRCLETPSRLLPKLSVSSSLDTSSSKGFEETLKCHCK